MSRRPSLSVIASTLGIFFSVAGGVVLAVRTVVPLLEQAAAVPASAAEPEGKAKGWDFWTIEIDNLANELKGERARLTQQAELLDLRSARVAAEEKELAKVRGEIERLRREISERVLEISADEAKNVRTLSQTYANLTPRAVVAIFSEMEDATVVKILSLMKAEVVGPIFEEMAGTTGPEGSLARRAALLSEKLRLMKAAKPPGSA